MRVRGAGSASASGIPVGAYQFQFALLFGGIAAAREDAEESGDRRRVDELTRRLEPRMRTIGTLQKANRRGELDREIRLAREVLVDVMGKGWHPRLDSPVARAMQERDVDPRLIGQLQ